MLHAAIEGFSKGDCTALGQSRTPSGSYGRGRWFAMLVALLLAACFVASTALAKSRRGGEVFYTGLNLGVAKPLDSLTIEGLGYSWGGTFKYIESRYYGVGLTFNSATYACEAIDGSDIDAELRTATVDLLFPLDFIHERFDIYYTRAALYWSASLGLASESVELDGKSFSLGVDDSGYAAGLGVGMLYSYDLDPHRRQNEFGGLTLGGELRLLKFLEMDTTSAELQLNFTVGYSF